MMNNYDKYKFYKFMSIFLLIFSLCGVYLWEEDWLEYLINPTNYSKVEAKIISMKKEYGVGGRSSYTYTQFEYMYDGTCVRGKLKTCCTDYYHDTVVIGAGKNKVARLRPIIPTLDTGNIYCNIIYFFNVLCFILYLKYKRRYLLERKKVLSEWENENV